jgi:hypothetical protein
MDSTELDKLIVEIRQIRQRIDNKLDQILEILQPSSGPISASRSREIADSQIRATAKSLIEQYLHDRPGDCHYAMEIAAHLGVSLADVSQLLEELHAGGLIIANEEMSLMRYKGK